MVFFIEPMRFSIETLVVKTWRHKIAMTLQWRHNERGGVSNHRHLNCVLNCLFTHRSKKTPKLRVTGPCEENSLVTGEFPAQRASNAGKVSIWWRHHGIFPRQTRHGLTGGNGFRCCIKYSSSTLFYVLQRHNASILYNRIKFCGFVVWLGDNSNWRNHLIGCWSKPGAPIYWRKCIAWSDDAYYISRNMHEKRCKALT